MLASEVVERARSQIGLKIHYELGRGGFLPDAKSAADSKGRCDCTGFLAWCFGAPRKVDLPLYRAELGQWVETSAIIRDAKSPAGMFVLVPVDEAHPGMAYVWGDSDGHQGHAAIISAVQDGRPSKAIHCSKGNFAKTGDAVQETGVAMFVAHDAIVARCAHVEHEAAVG